MLFGSVSSNHRPGEWCFLIRLFEMLAKECLPKSLLKFRRYYPIHTGILNPTTLSSKGHTLKYHFLTWISCGKRLVIDTFQSTKWSQS